MPEKGSLGCGSGAPQAILDAHPQGPQPISRSDTDSRARFRTLSSRSESRPAPPAVEMDYRKGMVHIVGDKWLNAEELSQLVFLLVSHRPPRQRQAATHAVPQKKGRYQNKKEPEMVEPFETMVLMRRIADRLDHLCNVLSAQHPAKPSADPSTEAKLALALEEMDLSVRSLHCLYSEGIRTVRDLVTRSSDDLLDIRNFGEVSLNDVRGKLAQMGLSLRDPRRNGLGS